MTRNESLEARGSAEEEVPTLLVHLKLNTLSRLRFGMVVSKEGYLTKLGAKFPTWRRRYFVLVGCKLYYFKSVKEYRMNRAQGEIMLHGASVALANHVEKEFAFQVTPRGAKRSYLICAASRQERDEWMQAVSNSISDEVAEQFSGLKRSENSIREGYLTKQGAQVKNWKRRYFVLNDNILVYFGSQTEAEPLGSINLLGSRVKLEEKSVVGFDHALSVTLADGRRKYIMYADTEHDRMQWFDALKKCRVFNTNLPDSEEPDANEVQEVEEKNNNGLGAPNSQDRLTTRSVIGSAMSSIVKSGNNLKQKVSKKKRRFVQDGFDLDLTYITDRIIAMGFPSEKIESIYRNSMVDVRRFLDSRHGTHYRVYNLCSERAYDASKFDGRVVRFPFDDHNCPRFEDLVPLCEDIRGWLAANPENVCAIHCKAGKGRTGLVICVYLLYSEAWQSAQEALSYYAYVRTKNQKGVTIPSQRRWVYYFEKFMQRRREGKAIPDRGPLKLNEIYVGPQAKQFDYIEIINNGVKYTSRSWGKFWKQAGEGGGVLVKPPQGSVKLHRDFKADFYSSGLMGKKKRVWSFWANTCFIDNDCLILDKSSLDKVNKDKEAPFFRMEVFFNDAEKNNTNIDILMNPPKPITEESSSSSSEEDDDPEDVVSDGSIGSDDGGAVDRTRIQLDEVQWWGKNSPRSATLTPVFSSEDPNDDDDEKQE